MKTKWLCFVILAIFSISCTQVLWKIEKTIRKPGEKMVTLPDLVAKEYNCNNRKLPFFAVEENEVFPTKMKPGEEFNHHFVYVMCPAVPAQVINSTLYRRIYYEGKVIFQDVTKNFKLKPGRWAIDAYIITPPQAFPGIYSLEMAIISAPIKFKDSRSFVIKNGGNKK